MFKKKADTFLYYYLLYKLKTSPNFWIVKMSDNIIEVDNNLDNFYSTIEKYYIVSKLDTDNNYRNFKSFTIFKTDKTCDIIYETT